jgi:hypothetical protein
MPFLLIGVADDAESLLTDLAVIARGDRATDMGRSRVDPGLSLPGSTGLRVESIVKKVPRQGTGSELAKKPWVKRGPKSKEGIITKSYPIARSRWWHKSHKSSLLQNFRGRRVGDIV